MNNLFNSLGNLFKSTSARYPQDSVNEPALISQIKVLALVFDPIMDKASGATLSQTMKWYRATDLITGFMADLVLISNGMARYQIVQRIDIDEFPQKIDRFRYTPETYLDVLQKKATVHLPQDVSYDVILKKYDILQRVAKGQIDEVWIFGFPNAGFYESTMGGPGSFWCNAPPLKGTEASKRRFVIMGFSYERYVGEMFESYVHRAESIMDKTFSKLTGDANLLRHFTRYEKIAPGKAACVKVPLSPNTPQHSYWNNPTAVKSECYDWLLNFPNFKGDLRMVGPSEWGNGDLRKHHTWWLNHFPRVAGRKNGIHNNWWQYVANPNNVIV